MNRDAVPESALLHADSEVLSTELGNEVVLLNLRDGVYYGLDDVGARIWALLRQPVSVRMICDAILAEYEIDADRCERDVRAVVADLARCGLISVQGIR